MIEVIDTVVKVGLTIGIVGVCLWFADWVVGML